MKKLIKILLVFISFILLIIIVFGQFSFSFTKKNYSKSDYSNVLERAVLNDETLVVDIAMLGAHDAFSNKIKYSSKVDPAEDESSILNNKLAKIFGKGMFVRLAKAQKSSAKQLLVKGVRYFDIRVSFYQDKYYTKHGLISEELDRYILEILEFLEKNKKEFVILDFQHIFLGDKSFEDMYDYLNNIKFNEKSIFDYIYYNTEEIKIGDLKYKDVVKDGAGIVFLAKNEITDKLNKHFVYDDSIMSIWHNKNTTKDLLNSINSLTEELKKDNSKKDLLRVNQAQMTGIIGGKETINTIINWSLLDMAEWFNSIIIKQDNIDDWFDTMPILMVDFADSSKGNFNDVINEYIIKYNKEK